MLDQFLMWLFRRSILKAEIEASRFRNALLGNDRKAAKSWLHDSHWQ